MSYTVRKRNGASLIVLADQEVNGDYSVTLTGRKVNSYGEIQQDNFIWLTENFADNVAPTKPLTGQLWYNTSTKTLCLCTESKEGKNASWTKLFYIRTEPSLNPEAGEMYYDADKSKLMVWDGFAWRAIGPVFDNYQRVFNTNFKATNSITNTQEYAFSAEQLDLHNGDVVSFTATIIARSTEAPAVYCGQWIITGLAVCNGEILQLIGEPDIRSRVSDSAQVKAWYVNSMNKPSSGGNQWTFEVFGETDSNVDNITWKCNLEIIINPADVD